MSGSGEGDLGVPILFLMELRSLWFATATEAHNLFLDYFLSA